MSTQAGILSVMSSKKLWTAPSKEQYLPAYLKSLCDEYSASPDAHRMLPVKGIGLQKAASTPTWIFASNFQVELKEGRARRIPYSDSPFCVIGSKEESLAFSDIEGSLDEGDCLKNLIHAESELMGENFLSSVFILGGLGIAIHFEQLSRQFNGVPFVMAYGSPVSGKSSAVEAAMAIIGQTEKVGECTLAGAMKLVGNRSLPFWWDDVDNFSVLEQVIVAVYNKANKISAKTKGCNNAMTVPIMTMNPTTLVKSVRNNKEKMMRTFSRTVVIPFTTLKKGRQSLANSLRLQTRMKQILPDLLKSVGILIELRDDFQDIQLNDPLFNEVIDIIGETKLEVDMRAQCNYALLLYTTIKILEKIGLKEKHESQLKEWMVNVILPCYVDLVGTDRNEMTADSSDNPQTSIVSPMRKLLVDLVLKVIANPEEGKGFFNPCISARKCDCGDVFGFNVGKAMDFVGQQGQDNAFRSYVRRTSIGCNGVKLIIGQKQFVGTHIKLKFLTQELRDELNKAFQRCHQVGSTNKPVGSKVSIPGAEVPEEDSSGGSSEMQPTVVNPGIAISGADVSDEDSSGGSFEMQPTIVNPGMAISGADVPEEDSSGGSSEMQPTIVAPRVAISGADVPEEDSSGGSFEMQPTIVNPGMAISGADVSEEVAYGGSSEMESTIVNPGVAISERTGQSSKRRNPLKDSLGAYFTPRNSKRTKNI